MFEGQNKIKRASVVCGGASACRKSQYIYSEKRP